MEKSLQFKKTYIEADEFDWDVRIQLNFARTFGHVYEVMSHYAIPHGTAIAMGVITAHHISVQRGWHSPETSERIESIIWVIINVPSCYTQTDMTVVIDAV